ncbi:MAG: LPS assembly protein LptD [Gammaproteobacteria bacterium]|nr:LPS assembly protein LptD [Gammaproteobacteria bacterium]
MSEKTRIIPVFFGLGVLLLVPTAWGSEPAWDCNAGPGNTWECSKSGLPDSTTPIATKPASTTGSATTTHPTTASHQPVYVESTSAAKQTEGTVTATLEHTAPVIGVREPQSSDTLRIDRDLNWNQCGSLNSPAIVQSYSNETQITSDAADVSRENKLAIFSGSVVVTKGDQLLEADRITYNSRNETMDADGSIYYQSPGLLISGSSAQMDMGENKGSLNDVEYRLPKRRARGSASLAEIVGSEQSRFKNISYTTCRPGSEDWMLEAEELEINQETGVGVAHDTVVRFKGVPFFYLPYASFPIDDRRKTGVLVPTIGRSDETGADISVPYYINIAPDMDATITPRIMSKRGLMVAGEFRYLTENYESSTTLELLPNDKDRENDENSARGAFSYNGHGNLAPRLVLDANINYASDHDYLEDLGDSLAVSSSRYLERRGDLRYHGNNWNILGRAQYYQTMDETIAREDRPYARLPQVLFTYKQPDQFGGATLHMGAEYVYFHRDETVNGHRFDINPAISVPMRNSWSYITPKLGVRYTSYNLKDQDSGAPDSPDRTTSTFSLDSGMFFDRVGINTTSTLEPRLFYLYTPKETQDDLPDFDTGTYDFSFYNMFRENRFSGADRVGDANQLTLAITSRNFSNDTGEESFRFSIGEIFYFEDREIQLPGVSTVDDSSSALVSQVAMRLSQNWSTQADLEWDHNHDNNKTSQSAFHLRYDNQQSTLLNLGYRYARDHENDAVLFEQSDISFRFPITSRLNAVGRWDYSLRHDKTMEAFAGLEYSNCCYAVRAVGRHYINDVDDNANTAFYLQLELKGLTSIGNKVGDFLEDNLLGYTRAE